MFKAEYIVYVWIYISKYTS